MMLIVGVKSYMDVSSETSDIRVILCVCVCVCVCLLCMCVMYVCMCVYVCVRTWVEYHGMNVTSTP